MFQKKYLLVCLAAVLFFATGCPKPQEDDCGAIRVTCVNASGQAVDGIMVKGAYLTSYYDGEYVTFQDTMRTGTRGSGTAEVFACKGGAISTSSNTEYKAASATVVDFSPITITLQRR